MYKNKYSRCFRNECWYINVLDVDIKSSETFSKPDI